MEHPGVTRYTRSNGQTGSRYVIEIDDQKDLALPGSFRDWEEQLAACMNQVSVDLTHARLSAFDTQGEPLVRDGVTWTSKGKVKRVIESLGGAFDIERYVYQTSQGGGTRAPMDERAGLMGSSTPRFACIVGAKISEMTAASTARDLKIGHDRTISPSFAQDIGCAINQRANDLLEVMPWHPEAAVADVAKIVVGLDGAMIDTVKSNGKGKPKDKCWRQAHCGTFSLYDAEGERLETIYLGAGPGVTPPEGSEYFFAQAKNYLARIKAHYPDAEVYGISDGASDLQAWLREQVGPKNVSLDFFHAAEYLTGAAPGMKGAPGVEESLGDAELLAGAWRQLLLEEPGGAEQVLVMMSDQLRSQGETMAEGKRKGLSDAVTYFTNHLDQMNYAEMRAQGRPIGSGVTESSCKLVIKPKFSFEHGKTASADRCCS